MPIKQQIMPQSIKVDHSYIRIETYIKLYILWIFSNVFPWKKMFVSWFKFHFILFLKSHLVRCQHWLKQRLGTEQVTSQYLNQWWPNSLRHTWHQYCQGSCIDGLMQKRRNSIANALELRLFCIKPLKCNTYLKKADIDPTSYMSYVYRSPYRKE